MKIDIIMIISVFFFLVSCGDNSDEDINNDAANNMAFVELPLRPGERPATTDGIPHTQLNLDLVPSVHEEMIRRIFSIPGLANEPSVILSWEGLWIASDIEIINPQAIISDREFGHIHDDGSLHIFLEPNRAIEAIDAGWAVSHPFAVEGRDGWEGFVLLYTPQNIEELNIVFQLIVEAFNFVTGQEIKATDFY